MLQDKPISLLYVEDDEDTRNLVSGMLRRRFPHVRCYSAENGEKGLELFMSHRPCLVITDLNMPVIDGVVMSRIIKSLSPSTIIIAMTAYHNTLVQIKGESNCIDHYLLKPIDYNAAFRLLNDCIHTLQKETDGAGGHHYHPFRQSGD